LISLINRNYFILLLALQPKWDGRIEKEKRLEIVSHEKK